MEQIEIKEKRGANYVLLEVAGVLNSYTYLDFQTKVFAIAKETNLVIDMAEITNLSSSGLGVLLAAYDDADEAGNKIYIMRPSVIAKKAIESTGFAEYFPIIFSLTEVL
ncbi:MAG: STAS domain-containing protein [Treponema sp.]|mgnify:CR=1 FL=1|jgi:anti-anti-sigma factor|nr:STAS domain-containing protein [Treponema sp.]